MSLPATVPTADRADPVLDRLKHLHPKVIDLSLGRTFRMLEAVGSPHTRLPPVVHVAGTNGKGSTIAFLRAFLEAAGKRVHVYTSPHLVRFHERIRLAGDLIDDDYLAEILEECEQANRGEPITYFEITTVAALLAFSRTPADVVLLETGLGGRLDSTNVIERPAVTALTRISYDHMQFLGETLTAIAGEKAGIMRLGVPSVVAPQSSAEVTAAFRERAAAIGAPLFEAGEAWRSFANGEGFRFESPLRNVDLPLPALPGAHQIVNAGVALACLDHLPGIAVSDEAVRKGLVEVRWPGRLQRLTRGPLVDRLPPGWDLWLDGGHNDSAGEVLGAQAARWREADGLPLKLIFGMLATKEPRDFLRPLSGFASTLRAVAIPGEEASLSPDNAASAAQAVGFEDAEAVENVDTALDALIRRDPSPTRVMICGSLYLAGAVLARNG
ncbi:bifunctional folylpolyglutamate synthase/dihydrofolate synthase [Skermanella aerolata]|uniref:tetrahydrofolate synthase n=1 Tax=Skermanella aerolata TaxID=393310 RepID=A0A512DVH5_9PROT|nr:folylpolyglutamate synthase/dihydrofolate synthase family protein [Skermanella aerolata]KJB95036.1 folylpolyglutamate synthase [Skermanella aerolata KACC 11604]GEO40250.1 bifunctional folylpolyglutamate synthase/dihydrofolate synthase [Skermanella aerolata]